MSNDTKDRILKAALEIFSRYGYAGANLKDIAGAVGVVKSGFYRHYTGKEELWNAVLDEMERYYAERFGSAENLPAIPQSTDELKTLTLRMLDFTLHDEKIIEPIGSKIAFQNLRKRRYGSPCLEKRELQRAEG